MFLSPETNFPSEPTCPTDGGEDEDDSSSGSDDAAIYAGVVGAIVAVVVVTLLIVFIVWYQFWRKDSDEDASKGSAFDFTKGRVDASNPTPSSPMSEKQAMQMESLDNKESSQV